MASLQDINQNADFSITMPALACSFPCRLHPHALHLIKVSDASLVDRCKPITSAWPENKLIAELFAPHHLLNSAFGLAIALFYANAISTQRIFPILKLFNWYFMLDNCVDEPGTWGTDPVKSTHIINRVMAVFVPAKHKGAPVGKPYQLPSLTGNDDLPILCGEGSIEDNGGVDVRGLQAHIVQELAHILTSTAAEWWSDMCVDMPLSQQLKFCEIFRGFLSCILKESSFRSACTLPDVCGYLCIRSQTIGWYPLAVLTEYTLCMELDQEVMTNPLLTALMKSLCESIIIVNDIMSFGKEYGRGDLFNIIMVLCLQKLRANHDAAPLPNYDSWPALVTPELLQESMNEACELVKERDQQCVCMIEKIKVSPELMEKDGMGAFLEAMGNYVAGNIYWHLSSERYGICANGGNYNTTSEKIEKDMAHLLGPRTLLLKRPKLLNHLLHAN